MADIAIRKLGGDEKLRVRYQLNAYAFHATPPLMDEQKWRESASPGEDVTYLALFEDAKPVSGAAGTPMIQHVRGKLFAANGLWGVATAPGARRNGYCHRVIAQLLSTLRDDGHVFTNLYPFRESFYERLGYVTFPLPRIAKLAPSALLPLMQDLDGQVELTLIGDGLDVYQDYVRRLLQRTHGMALFLGEDQVSDLRKSAWMALAKVRGEPAGLMLYRIEGEGEPPILLRAVRFYYETSLGRYLLLQWIARHIDQVDRAEIWLPPFEQPETWLSDMQVKTESQVRAPMGRVLDVSRLGGMQAGAGCLAARIADPLCPWNEGVWRFESPDGVLRVTPADEADCDLSIQALTALVYGTHDPGDFAIRKWGNPSPAVQAILRTMFPPKLPYLHEYF